MNQKQKKKKAFNKDIYGKIFSSREGQKFKEELEEFLVRAIALFRKRMDES